MTTQNGVQKREFNMDIERVLLIFMVIVLHYNNRAMGGALNYGYVGGIVEFLVRLSESMCICAVDAFLILSGYFAAGGFGSSNNIRKSISLLASCSFYRVVGYVIYATFVTGGFSVRTFVAYLIPSNWYVCLFATVLLLSPYINRLMGLLGDRSRREFIITTSVLFVVVPTFVSLVTDILNVDLSGLATITLNGDIDGFTIVCFIFCYCLGYFLRKEKDYCDKISIVNYCVIFLCTSLVATVISYKSERVWSYSDIFTVLEAVTLTLAFSKLNVRSVRVGKIFSEIGKCGLGIFVWHTMPLMIFGFWVHLNIDQISNGNVWQYIGNFWVATLSMYALSLVWVWSAGKLTKVVRHLNRQG